MSQRIKKVNELLRHLVAKAIEDIATKGFITVKAVETARNMKHADIWVGVIGEDEASVLDFLEENRRDIQSEVARQLKSKNVPVLEFKIDHSGEHAAKIEELLKDGG